MIYELILLIYREQEKLLDIDNKLTTLLGLEYKIERVLEKLDTFDNKLLELVEKIENSENPQTQNSPKETIWNEFAGIGVLSTLKNIENKIDKLQVSIYTIFHLFVSQLIYIFTADTSKIV